MNETHLTGLEGTNPLGFLAALGVQVAFASESRQPRLWWSDDVTPHAVVDGEFTIDGIADRALAVFAEWGESPAVNPRRPDGSAMPKGDEVKLAPEDMRSYLGQARECDSGGALPMALVAEGSLDKQGVAKPSDFYFTAGNMKFLDIARKILNCVSREDMFAGLKGPWPYQSKLSSIMWDVSDDRVYALRANDPAEREEAYQSRPGSLGRTGIEPVPRVRRNRGRTLTQGCSGKWKAGHYSWPMWCRPASPHTVKSLLAHAYHHPTATDRECWFRAWGFPRFSSRRSAGPGGEATAHSGHRRSYGGHLLSNSKESGTPDGHA